MNSFTNIKMFTLRIIIIKNSQILNLRFTWTIFTNYIKVDRLPNTNG